VRRVWSASIAHSSGRANYSLKRTAAALKTRAEHVYEVRPRKDHRGVDLISDALPFGRAVVRRAKRSRQWVVVQFQSEPKAFGISFSKIAQSPCL
jgi:hypothetical protein